jgi:hypothetical protein
MATGVFWDGRLCFPNPIELALWESNQIWPESIIDVIITLGTGIKPKRASNTSGNSICQLWNSFMDFLDGETRFRDFEHGIGKDIKGNLFRFNTKLHGPTRLNNIKDMDLVRQSVHLSLHSHTSLMDVTSALLISSFYFELDVPPVFESGIYHYQGSIHCRTNCSAVMNALARVHLSQIKYVTATKVLAEYRLNRNIYPVYHRYQKDITLHVRHPDNVVTISLQIINGHTRKISGFPQRMSWFKEEQGLHHAFGIEDHDMLGAPRCFSCCQMSIQGPWKHTITLTDSGRQKRIQR